MVDEDLLIDEYKDDTAGPPQIQVPLAAPEGWVIDARPEELPTISRLLRRSVMRYVLVNAKSEAGWIRSEIAGGPKDPSAALLGITMRLKCTKALDAR